MRDSRGQRGMALAEVLVALGIFGLVASQFTSLLTQMYQLQRNAMAQQTLFYKRETVRQYFANQLSWDLTRSNPANNFSCLGKNCTSGREFLLRLFDSAGKVYFNSQRPTAGFDADGRNCDTFSATNPDSRCPFRMTLYWRPQCPGAASCARPALAVGVRFEYAGTSYGPLNAARFNFDSLRETLDNTLEHSCVALGGTFDPVANSCNILRKLASLGECGPGQVIRGFDASGSIKCVAAGSSQTPISTQVQPKCPCGTCGMPMCLKRKWDGSCDQAGICTAAGIRGTGASGL